MEILQTKQNLNLVLNGEQHFKTDAGWEENLIDLETEILSDIINPIDNYETIRYIHKPYISTNNVNQTDIWFYFYFLDTGATYTNGLDYSLVGIPPHDNMLLLKDTTKSFFRLEFFKTPNDEAPDRNNRKLVMSRNLSLPLGEKYYYTGIRHNIFLPVFTGNNYRNTENMYLFWFMDDSALTPKTLSGDTFWMTGKFFNATDGTVMDFTTTGLTAGQEVVETRDMYYKMVIDRTDYSYQIFRYDGTTTGSRIGESNDPIKFYEKRQ